MRAFRFWTTCSGSSTPICAKRRCSASRRCVFASAATTGEKYLFLVHESCLASAKRVTQALTLFCLFPKSDTIGARRVLSCFAGAVLVSDAESAHLWTLCTLFCLDTTPNTIVRRVSKRAIGITTCGFRFRKCSRFNLTIH